MRTSYYIGIDPDVTASGFAVYDAALRTVTIEQLPFFDVIASLEKMGGDIHTVVVEAGWLNKKSNFHAYGKGENVSARIGKNVGANHQIGRLFVEWCERYGIKCMQIQPTKTKVNPKVAEFVTGIKFLKVDQDAIDALFMLNNCIDLDKVEKFVYSKRQKHA